MDPRRGAGRQRRRGAARSTPKRVCAMFIAMSSPTRIDALRILDSSGPLHYTELKALAGFRSKNDSSKFAYHLRKILQRSLVELDRDERRYVITGLGRLALSMARQMEERTAAR